MRASGNTSLEETLRFLLLTVVAAATIGLAAGPAGARNLQIPHVKPFSKMTNTQKVSWLKRQIHKDESVIRFWKNHRYLLDDAEFPNAGKQARNDVRWATTSLRIANRNLEKLLAWTVPLTSTASCTAGPVQQIICNVFGAYGDQALRVSKCESGYDVRAVNGQYLGIFQMGDGERAKYGHGSDALTQARSAYSYFVSSGKDWSPWGCKP